MSGPSEEQISFGLSRLCRQENERKKMRASFQAAGFEKEVAKDIATLAHMVVSEDDSEFALKFLGNVSKRQLSDILRGQEIDPAIRTQMENAAKQYREWLDSDEN